LTLPDIAQKIIIIFKNKIMQTFKSINALFVLVSFFFIHSCNEASRTAENKNTDTSTTTVGKSNTIGPLYDASIDHSIVGAAFTKIIHDSLGIKMSEVTLKPGDSLGFHSHPDHAFYLLDTSTVILYLPGRNKGDTISGGLPGTGGIMGPFNDAGKNIGKTNVRLLEIDVHRPRGTEMPAKPAYDATIDAFTLGGESIQKLGDTLGIKMFIATMKPGETAALHSHPDHTVYVLEGGVLDVTFQGAGRQIMKMEKGTGFVGGPFSDEAKNIGKTTVKLLMTHIYRPRVK
jgi:quercetin dioxygenase-like cupin family protein